MGQERGCRRTQLSPGDAEAYYISIDAKALLFVDRQCLNVLTFKDFLSESLLDSSRPQPHVTPDPQSGLGNWFSIENDLSSWGYLPQVSF